MLEGTTGDQGKYLPRIAIDDGVIAVATYVDIRIIEQQADDSWEETQTIENPTPQSSPNFPDSLAMADGRLFAGSEFAGGPDLGGSVFVYSRGGDGSFTQDREVKPDEPKPYGFGGAVGAMPGHFAASLRDSENSTTSVVVFEEQGDGSWQQVAEFTEEQPAYGVVIEMDGETMTVSAPGIDGVDGALYTYVRDDRGGWSFEQMLQGPTESTRFFGNAVALRQDRLLVSTIASVSGEVFDVATLYERDTNGDWEAVGRLSVDRAEFFVDVSMIGEQVTLGDGIALIGNGIADSRLEFATFVYEL